MIKFVQGLATFIVLAFSLLSCQKEIEEVNVNRVESDSSYISKVVTLDTTLPRGSDTITKIFFRYDNLNRLSEMFSYYPGTTDTLIQSFRYTGNDTLPQLFIEKFIGYNGPGTYYIDTVFYSFSNAFVSKDSLIQWVYPGNVFDYASTGTYLKSGNSVKIYQKKYGYVAGLFTLLNSDSATYNTSFNSGSLTSQTLLTGDAGFYNSVQITYDGKKNPFNKIIKIRYPLIENIQFAQWFYQQSNPTFIQYQRRFSTPATEQHTYIYRADNYPIISTFFNSQGFGTSNKLLYFYTSL
jgi:hypothetical protein